MFQRVTHQRSATHFALFHFSERSNSLCADPDDRQPFAESQSQNRTSNRDAWIENYSESFAQESCESSGSASAACAAPADWRRKTLELSEELRRRQQILERKEAEFERFKAEEFARALKEKEHLAEKAKTLETLPLSLGSGSIPIPTEPPIGRREFP